MLENGQFEGRYDTNRLDDLIASECIANKVRGFFGQYMDQIVKSFPKTTPPGILLTDTYNYAGATIILRHWKITEYDPKAHQLGVVSCKWATSNQVVHEHIIDKLKTIDGLFPDSPNYNLSY